MAKADPTAQHNEPAEFEDTDSYGLEYETRGVPNPGEGRKHSRVSLVDAHEPEPLPVGTYNFKIAEAKAGWSKNDNEQIVLELRVLGGEYDDKKVYHYLTFTDANSGRVERELAAIYGKSMRVEFDPEELATDLEGRTFRAVTKLGDVYNGRRSPKIDNILGPATTGRASASF